MREAEPLPLLVLPTKVVDEGLRLLHRCSSLLCVRRNYPVQTMYDHFDVSLLKFICERVCLEGGQNFARHVRLALVDKPGAPKSLNSFHIRQEPGRLLFSLHGFFQHLHRKNVGVIQPVLSLSRVAQTVRDVEAGNHLNRLKDPWKMVRKQLPIRVVLPKTIQTIDKVHGLQLGLRTARQGQFYTSVEEWGYLVEESVHVALDWDQVVDPVEEKLLVEMAHTVLR